jgi:hypothetical protein
MLLFRSSFRLQLEYYVDAILHPRYTGVKQVPYEVNFTEEFEMWWDGLTTEQQEDVAARVTLLEQHGPSLGRPIVDQVSSSTFHNLKELRCSSGGALRVLFAFDPRQEAILLLGGDKRGNWDTWYREAVRRADELYAKYLEELRREGLI